jgi:hypothetical protein
MDGASLIQAHTAEEFSTDPESLRPFTSRWLSYIYVCAGRSVLKVMVDNLEVEDLRGLPSGQQWPGISEVGVRLHMNTSVGTNVW